MRSWNSYGSLGSRTRNDFFLRYINVKDKKCVIHNSTIKEYLLSLTCLVGVKLTSVKAESGIEFEPLQPVPDCNVLFCEELLQVFLLLIRSDMIDSSLEIKSLKWNNKKVLSKKL